ncbi:MAG TPA: class I SAM-dependent methyltransferase [Stellaceae bacterium]|jgi:2-polyprenyl-3-methyl-5-hydroxy-6-metoxy-1,4-benzoquinol methylase|nr:class I SAM-dependent methyltransferase [Stellaceae bacterium]
MFASSLVEQHLRLRLWGVAVEIGRQLGLDADARVLDLGCGDGAFANHTLAANFAAVDGFDFSEAAIRRATENAAGAHMRFAARDVTRIDFTELPHYDGAFLIGILHHVKPVAPAILKGLRGNTGRVVVLEPNGGHVVRKLLELTPSYRAAGEDSFRRSRLLRLFAEAGYRTVVSRRLNLFPNFTPQTAFRLLRWLEPLVEATPVLRALCTVDMYGLEA